MRRKYTPLNIEDKRSTDESQESKNIGLIKAILLAFFLLIIGIFFFILSFLHGMGHFANKKGAGWGFFVLGMLTFIPGFYHCRIAYYTWRGYDGYSLNNIPSF